MSVFCLSDLKNAPFRTAPMSRGAFEHIAPLLNFLIASPNSILPGANPIGAALESLGQHNGTSLTWICDFASGELSHSVTRSPLECFSPRLLSRFRYP